MLSGHGRQRLPAASKAVASLFAFANAVLQWQPGIVSKTNSDNTVDPAPAVLIARFCLAVADSKQRPRKANASENLTLGILLTNNSVQSGTVPSLLVLSCLLCSSTDIARPNGLVFVLFLPLSS